jgi:uncharacterized protein YjbJ (UPF0337 family)
MDTDRIEGKAKEAEGKLTGDESREAEGRMQDKWGETKDKAGDAFEGAKDKVGRKINEADERDEDEPA